MDKKYELDDALNETIDRLIDAGMREPDAIALVCRLLEQQAREFIYWDDYFNDDEPDCPIHLGLPA